MNPVRIVFSFLIILFVTSWLGLRVKPKPFPLAILPQAEIKTVPLPKNLPVPVEDFYRTVYSDQIPVIESVVIAGRGKIRPFGVWLPARFVFIHNAGKEYRHYIEATFFGLPFLKVNEDILDSKSFFESPMGNYHDDPNINQGANLALWAEAGWFPALWITTPRSMAGSGRADCHPVRSLRERRGNLGSALRSRNRADRHAGVHAVPGSG